MCFLGLARNVDFCFFLQLLTGLSFNPFLEPLSLSPLGKLPFHWTSFPGWWCDGNMNIGIVTCIYCNIRWIFHHRFDEWRVHDAVNWYYCLCCGWFFKNWQYFSVCNIAMVGHFSVVHWPRLYHFWLNCISIMSPEGWIVDFTLSLFEHLQPLLGKSRQCKSHCKLISKNLNFYYVFVQCS